MIPISLLLAAALAGGSPQPEAVVGSYIEAYNRQDLAAMLDLADEQVAWMSVAASRIAVETGNRAELERAMGDYFRACPSCRAEVEILGSNGPFVSTLETAHWSADGTPRSARSLAVYEVRDGKVLHVWYYGAIGLD